MRTRNREVTAILLVTGSLLASACSTNPTIGLAKERAEAERVREDALAAQATRESARKQAQLETVPAWAMDIPKPDARGVYALGIGQGDSIQLALDKAKLQSAFGIAKVLKQELSGNERMYQQDAGRGTSTERYSALVDTLVARVQLAGQETMKQEVKANDGRFHAYVLMFLPYEEFNQVLRARRQAETDKNMAKEVVELERRVEAKQQRTEQDLNSR